MGKGVRIPDAKERREAAADVVRAVDELNAALDRADDLGLRYVVRSAGHEAHALSNATSRLALDAGQRLFLTTLQHVDIRDYL